MKKIEKIFIAGATGLVGSTLKQQLIKQGYINLLTPTRAELDLLDPFAVYDYFSVHKPDYVFFAAAKVGGIHANNTYRADFIYQNLAIQLNIIDAAKRYESKRLLFLGSSCIYPRDCPQPMCENHLLSGYLEKTNEPYAIAKIAGIKMCEAYNAQYGTDFISVMPTNLYGPRDNFDLNNSHVLPALVRKIHYAKIKNESNVTLWGTGSALREFLYSEDLADACIFVMNQSGPQPMMNIGSGHEITIKGLAEMIADIVSFTGDILFDSSKPDGTPRKLLDSRKINALGWQPKISLREGITNTYQWFLKNHEDSE
jgi:GDP-L-fucose synthase